MLQDNERYQRGWEILNEVDGEAGPRVVESLSDIAPDLGRFIVEYGFGDVYSRANLVPKQRQLVTIGSLASLGGCEPQLEVHINAALNVGLTTSEIAEAIIHVSVYAGFPRALNAMFVAKKVFSERGLLPVAGDGAA